MMLAELDHQPTSPPGLSEATPLSLRPMAERRGGDRPVSPLLATRWSRERGGAERRGEARLGLGPSRASKRPGAEAGLAAALARCAARRGGGPR
jgi:hypothetical protein